MQRSRSSVEWLIAASFLLCVSLSPLLSFLFFPSVQIAHWGNTARIENSEMHDVRVSAMLFGEASLVNVLVTGRTPNLRSNFLISQNDNKMGFQFYDTHVRTILSGVTFRNFSAANKEFAIRYMDHSDHYTP